MPDTSKNKIRYGLKKCYYAPITVNAQTGAETFGTPVALPGAKTITCAPSGEPTTIYADDIPYFIVNAATGYEINLELLLIPEEFKIACLGQKKSENGILVESTKDQFKPFALLFEFLGDQKAVRHAFWKCTASRPNVDGDTKGEGITEKTETIPIKAVPFGDAEEVHGQCDDTTETAYTNWYTSVQSPTWTISGGGEDPEDPEEN